MKRLNLRVICNWKLVIEMLETALENRSDCNAAVQRSSFSDLFSAKRQPEDTVHILAFLSRQQIMKVVRDSYKLRAKKLLLIAPTVFSLPTKQLPPKPFAGVISIEDDIEQLLKAVDTVLAGRQFVSDDIRRRCAPDAGDPGLSQVLRQLSVRELEILGLIAEGFTNKEIALGLNLQEKTIKTYLTTIYSKLQVRNRVEAATLYCQANDETPLSDVGRLSLWPKAPVGELQEV